ncbi:hypothetical protein [Streptomyces sp. AK02-01A]|uniref:hypothetical protein n=1 Tax=Streptomyces sp. AK02-01A TaxID=3028648 RepID=UPI0029A7AC43|nr:hypothetical protein [Streptomyces sp. AK02-01A]MDX3850175.1 hypothetical protein [Streptomyces sp. AK02-01A]
MSAPGGGLTQWLGLAGILILLIALTHWLVRRQGGWRVLRRRVGRQVRLTVEAFTAPVRAQLRYRRRLRLLTRLLRDRSGWPDAERAVRRAAGLRPGFRPYGALLGPDLVGVLVAGVAESGRAELPDPWTADEAEPRLWWIARADLAGPALPSSGPDGPDGLTGPDAGPEPDAAPGTVAPLLCCVGTDGRHAVFLDLLAGPTTVSVFGVSRTARAVLQSLAAQLDARLPAGSVEVTSGVHQHHTGRTTADVLAAPGGMFAVCAEPPRTRLPDGLRLLCLGAGRDRARLLEAGPDGLLDIHGAAPSLRVDSLPLARAVVRALRGLPPYPVDGDGAAPGQAGLPAAGAAPAVHGAASDVPDELGEGASSAGAAGVSAMAEATAVAGRSSAPTGAPSDDDDLAEPVESGTAGVSAAAAQAP